MSFFISPKTGSERGRVKLCFLEASSAAHESYGGSTEKKDTKSKNASKRREARGLSERKGSRV
ncbi:hypothetical protein AZI87_04300 [Bdellovibrio bacteriovorus]|uniref:Uncharacterized protein n=1 Tax=Bdellovibrio bacteriovorus TaxID=959 RepID=A0A161PUA9_BDEBC|nr:hypothetical protein AZI87_04300 [Bdellovibrio bacteriovorus]